VREADVFLFDEPLSNLDAKLRTELRRELKQLHKRLGATMIYVTHDQVEAMTLATRMAVMRNGVIQQIGTPAEVYAHPNTLFVATFLGSPGMNLLRGTLRRKGGSLSFRNDHMEIDVSGYDFRRALPENEACVLGVRPEDIAIDESSPRRGTVSLVEPMGNHRVIWLDYHGVQIASIAQDTATSMVDETVGFTIDSSRVSLFSEAGGDRL